MQNQNENLATNGQENLKASRRARLKNSRSGIGLLFLLAVTAFLRLYSLGSKPPHFDEGINGHFVTTIWRDGFYSYDPTNFHGPLYFYLCHLAEILLGRSVDSFRVMNGILSIVLVFTVYRFRVFLGRAAVAAAWVIAVSPAFMFYGRYAIHETLFILGQLFFVFGRFQWMGRPSRAAIWWMAAGIVILISTKETFFIFLGTWAIAEASVWFLERLENSNRPWSQWPSLSSVEKRDLFFATGLISGLAVLVVAALYTGFFERPSGLRDFVRAFAFWTKTGVGTVSGHEKPFAYWLELLVRYEWPLLFGLLVSIYSTIHLNTEDRKLRTLLLTGFGTCLAYSLIPYKTPWLILNFWPLAFFLLPSFQTRNLRTISRTTWLGILGAFFIFLSISLGKAWQISLVNSTDPKEPYVYVQTTRDYSVVMDVLKKKTEKNPEARNTPIVVMIQDPWPLPFDLSLYPKMRYAKLDDIAKDDSILAQAGLMLVDGSVLDGLKNVFPKRFARMKFQLRDAYGSGWALFDAELFQSVLPPDVAFEEAVAPREAK